MDLRPSHRVESSEELKKKKKVTINPRDPNSGIWDEALVFS